MRSSEKLGWCLEQPYWLLGVLLFGILRSITVNAAGLDLSGLQNFQSSCSTWAFSRDFGTTISEISKWKTESEQRLAEIRKFSHETCPNYLLRANAMDSVSSSSPGAAQITLPQFVSAEQTMATDSQTTSDHGRGISQWLAREYSAFDRILKRSGDGVANKPCARQIEQVIGDVQIRIKTIQAAVENIKTDCPGFAQVLNSAPARAPASAGMKGQGAPQAVSHSGKPMKDGAPTITGIETDKEKQTKGR